MIGMHLDLPVARGAIESGEILSAVERVEDFLDEWKRICVGLSFLVERTIVDTCSCLAVLLLDEDYRETPGTVGSADYSGFQESFDFLRDEFFVGSTVPISWAANGKCVSSFDSMRGDCAWSTILEIGREQIGEFLQQSLKRLDFVRGKCSLIESGEIGLLGFQNREHSLVDILSDVFGGEVESFDVADFVSLGGNWIEIVDWT